MSDLLQSASGLEGSIYGSELAIMEDSNGKISIRNLNFLFKGETNQRISEHQLNKNSSRLNNIFRISIINSSAGTI
jgi:hypothetical protein